MKKDNENYKVYFYLHILLMFLSLCGICSKKAASYPFFSVIFICYYGVMIMILAIYAVAWQQIIKRIPLTTAYANKAVGIIWGMVWGMIFFGEQMTVGKVVGIIMVMKGITCYVMSDEEPFLHADVKSDGSVGGKGNTEE